MPLTKEEHTAINRQNAKKSTGPRTPEGKARSRMNARRHGLTGQLLVFEEGERKEYNRYASDQRETWEPIGPLEDDLMQRMIDTGWILRRNEAMEFNLTGVESARVFECGKDGPLAGAAATHHFLFDTDEGMKRYETMGRHRARLEKSLSKYRADLIRAQATRHKIEANEAAPPPPPKPSEADRYYATEKRSQTGGQEPEDIKDMMDGIHVAHRMDPEAPRNFLLRSAYDKLWMAVLTGEETDAYNREMNRRARIKLGADPNSIPPSGWVPPGVTRMGTPRLGLPR